MLTTQSTRSAGFSVFFQVSFAVGSDWLRVRASFRSPLVPTVEAGVSQKSRVSCSYGVLYMALVSLIYSFDKKLTYTNIYIYMYVYVYICICIYVCVHRRPRPGFGRRARGRFRRCDRIRRCDRRCDRRRTQHNSWCYVACM